LSRIEFKLGKMNSNRSHDQKRQNQSTSIIYAADGTCYAPSIPSLEQGRTRKIVTGVVPNDRSEPGVLFELARDPQDSARTVFLQWKDGNAVVLRSIERGDQVFIPPDLESKTFPGLSLPNRLLPCGEPAEMLAELAVAISKFVVLRPDQLKVVTAFVLATWFPDCFEAAPFLWVVGPLGSGKSKLLRFLSCVCRRGLVAGDIRGGSLYKLMDVWHPTLLMDEFEAAGSGANTELLRMLRASSSPGVPTVRNGVGFSTYGLKAFSSRQPLSDAALLSRGLIISMAPTSFDTQPLREAAMRELESEFQPRLCMLRFQNHSAVRNQYASAIDLRGLSPRMKQIARALTAPLLGAAEDTSDLLRILAGCDDEERAERFLEPEWLVARTLFAVCHEGLSNQRLVSEILVGGIAAQLNQKLQVEGEEIKLGTKKVGLVLRSLGVPPVRLGRMGRGLVLTPGLKRKVHDIAAWLGIDRRAIEPSAAVEHGYGGGFCPLCEEFGLAGGLRFVALTKLARPTLSPSSNRLPTIDHWKDD
jgi:hypothetical protein